MKSLKTKRNVLMLVGGITIASIQLACILYKGKMDAINVISFTILQYLYMDLVKATFDIKMEELAVKNNGK
jgi:hypothetical protein